MLTKKILVSFLDRNWSPINSGVKMDTLPRRGEYVYMGMKYYEVINVIHSLDSKHMSCVIVSEVPNETKVKLID